MKATLVNTVSREDARMLAQHIRDQIHAGVFTAPQWADHLARLEAMAE